MDFKSLKTVAQGGYPSTEGISKNCSYVGLLLDDYAGCGSETTAILQYMYQHYVTDAFEKQISEVLKHIAVTEMHHHMLLGESIVALGGNPILVSANHRYWDGRNVNYTTNLVKLLKTDIEGEKAAIRMYESNLRVIKDPQLVKIISRIIEDEQVHLATFHELLQYAVFYEK